MEQTSLPLGAKVIMIVSIVISILLMMVVFSVPYHGSASYPGLLLGLSLILAPLLIIIGAISVLVRFNNLTLFLYSLGAIGPTLYTAYTLIDILTSPYSGGSPDLVELLSFVIPAVVIILFFIFSVSYLWRLRLHRSASVM